MRGLRTPDESAPATKRPRRRLEPAGEGSHARQTAVDVADGEPAVREAIRFVLNRFELLENEEIPRAIAVVSSISGEGVTTVADALGEVLSTDFGARVGVVDLSWPDQVSKDTEQPTGVYEIVTGRAEIDDVVNSGDEPSVDRFPSGATPRSERNAFARSKAFGRFFSELGERYDFVVLDVAPVLSSSHTLALLRYADAYLLVARDGVTTSDQVRETVSELQSIPRLGAVLNAHRSRTPKFIRRLLGD